MNYKTILIPISLVLAGSAWAQNEPTLDQLVARALKASPIVAARQLQVEEAQASTRSAGSPKNAELEIAPGVGFTNSNFMLGQSFDLSGTRAARARRARAEAEVAKARLRETQLDVGSDFLTAYASYAAALTNESNAKAGVDIAKATVESIRKRIEIGEAPALQLTRAEVELNRAEQSLTLATAELAVNRSIVNSLLGSVPTAEIPVVTWTPSADDVTFARTALGRHPMALEARARIEGARAAELEARRTGLPSLFAGVAADTWSMDRRPFQNENIGLQLRLTMPLFDRGENRYAIRSAEAAVKAREAELLEAERQIALDIQTAVQHLIAAREVAQSYETGIVPKAQQMVQAMQSGLESGLTSFLELLEAQKTLAQLSREASDAKRNLRLAEIRYLTAAASLPGLEDPKP